MNNSILLKRSLIISAIAILTFICFRYTLQNQFTLWDDDYYVTNDPYIKAFTTENLKVIFTQDITKNNYHPLCMLSLAVNYHFSQLNPMGYYLTNILIHIANVILIFIFSLSLGKRLKINENGQLFIASFCALWFGIHPMRVESVCWIAERKDVLYAFFYIAGMITYLKYFTEGKMKWYWITFALFVASCLSKPMAVVFPMSLLCLDFVLERTLNKKLITEKVLFFVTAFLFGAMAFYTQNKTGAVASFGVLTIAERVMYAAYGYVMYLSKFVNPTYLSTFYPYPYRFITGYLPGIYYAAPFIAIAIVAIPLYLTFKYNRKYFRIVGFGFGFFIANVIFVLQFISVGAAIMADRYSYVAYIGLFFMVAWFLYEATQKFENLKSAFVTVALVLSGILSYLCYERTYAWHDSETLLTDAIEKYPYRALLSYKWLGNYYFSIGELDKALENYGILTTLHAADKKVEENIAKINSIKAGGFIPPSPQVTGAPLAPQQSGAANGPNIYIDSVIAYSKTGDTLNAFKAYIKAIRQNTGSEKVLADSSFVFVQVKRFNEAIGIYSVLLKINTSNPFYYFYRGVAKFSLNNTKDAVTDWEIAVKYDNKDVKQSASYNLGVAYESFGDAKKALMYVEMAQKAGYAVAPDYLNKLREAAKKANK